MWSGRGARGEGARPTVQVETDPGEEESGEAERDCQCYLQGNPAGSDVLGDAGRFCGVVGYVCGGFDRLCGPTVCLRPVCGGGGPRTGGRGGGGGTAGVGRGA